MAAQERQAILIDDVTVDSRYIAALPNVRSELAVPLTTKNRVIGVIDLEAKDPGYFNEEHMRLLTLIASRMAAGIENAQRLHAHHTAGTDSPAAQRNRARVEFDLESGRTPGPDRRTLAAAHRLSDVQHFIAGSFG